MRNLSAKAALWKRSFAYAQDDIGRFFVAYYSFNTKSFGSFIQEEMIIKGKSSKGSVIAENDNIVEAYGKSDSENSVKSWYVYYKLDSVGTKNLADAAQELPGTDTSITVLIDGEQIISGLVQTPVTDGESFVTGEFTEIKAKDIGARMSGGYLKFNLSIREVSTEG